MCKENGCKKYSTYNVKGEKTAIYCLAHKLDGMVDVKNKTCFHPGCKVRSSFNTKGETKALYCYAHKLHEMVDVIHKTCIYPSCKVQPAFNTEDKIKAIYCSEHKLDGMVDIKHPTCIHTGCNVQPIFNAEGKTKALYCFAHKLDGMIDIKNKICKSSWCSTRVREKYDGYCRFCYVNMFPDKPASRNYKTKEYSVVEYVKTKFPNFLWIADKIVNGGCSKRRPDLLLDLLYQIVIIEIDENQHADYDCSCQNKRVMELSQDFGHRPIIFIRFNPDNYIKNGITTTSCWGPDGNGICAIKKSKKNEWTQRLKTLEDQINYWINPENMTNKTIETIQLFYDS